MYKERRVHEGRYKYLVVCPSCTKERWVSHAKATRCASCAGKESYTPATVARSDARKKGDGYITKQGYHLIFDGEGYVPAHRLLFPDLPEDHVVHHVDGDKLNNVPSNLYPCSKQIHRQVHGQLERLSYSLIQAGLITFENGTYSLSEPLVKLMENQKYDESRTDRQHGVGRIHSKSSESVICE